MSCNVSRIFGVALTFCYLAEKLTASEWDTLATVWARASAGSLQEWKSASLATR